MSRKSSRTHCSWVHYSFSEWHSNLCSLVSCTAVPEIVPRWSDILACSRVRRWWLRRIYLHTDVLYGRLLTFISSHSTASASSISSLLLVFRFQPPFWYYSESRKTWCRRAEGASGGVLRQNAGKCKNSYPACNYVFDPSPLTSPSSSSCSRPSVTLQSGRVNPSISWSALFSHISSPLWSLDFLALYLIWAKETQGSPLHITTMTK